MTSKREERALAVLLRRIEEANTEQEEKKRLLDKANQQRDALVYLAKQTTRESYYDDNGVPQYAMIRNILVRILEIKALLRKAGITPKNQLQAQSYEVELLKLFVLEVDGKPSLFSFRDMSFSDWLRIVITGDENILFSSFLGSDDRLKEDQTTRALKIVTSMQSKDVKKLIVLDGIGRFLSILGSILGPDVDNYDFEVPEIDPSTMKWHSLFFPKNVVVSEEMSDILAVEPSNDYIVYFNFCGIASLVQDLHERLCKFIEHGQPVFVSWSLEGSCKNKRVTELNKFGQFWRGSGNILKRKRGDEPILHPIGQPIGELAEVSDAAKELAKTIYRREISRRGFFVSVHAWKGSE